MALRYVRHIIAICICACISFLIQAQPISNLLEEGDKYIGISIQDKLDKQNLSVHLLGKERSLVGRWIEDGDSLCFYPLLAFQAGKEYQLKNNGNEFLRFYIPEIELSFPHIVSIYPQTDSLPANLLKIYLEFSEPMGESDPYQFIHLLDSSGDTLHLAFLYQLPALWNEDNTILALWLDPGRIKRDLLLNQKYGNPMEAGKSYQLIINKEFSSRRGESLRTAYSKYFRTGKSDREKPDVNTWKVQLPKADTHQSLHIDFQESMDWGALQDRISIHYNEEQISGNFSITTDCQHLWFRPDQEWQAGEYEIHADSRIEDLAGNNLNRLFDRDIQTQESLNKVIHIRKFHPVP